jgi:integrase
MKYCLCASRGNFIHGAIVIRTATISRAIKIALHVEDQAYLRESSICQLISETVEYRLGATPSVRRMVVHIQGGKGEQDRDVMLSPVLLEELRACRRCLRKKSVWLFPGNRWHSGDHPTDDKTPNSLASTLPAAPALRNVSIPKCSATASPLSCLEAGADLHTTKKAG